MPVNEQNVFAPWEDPKAKPLIKFENVTKRFGDFVAIDEDVSPGEIADSAVH